MVCSQEKLWFPPFSCIYMRWYVFLFAVCPFCNQSEEQFLSEPVAAASLQFVYLKKFFPMQSRLMSWELCSLNGLIDCSSSWVIFTGVAGEMLPSTNDISLYSLWWLSRSSSGKSLIKNYVSVIRAALPCVERVCRLAMKSRLLSVGLIFKDTHRHTHSPPTFCVQRIFTFRAVIKHLGEKSSWVNCTIGF